MYYITTAIIRIQSCPPVGRGFHCTQPLSSTYPLLGAYLLTTYTYKHICLLTRATVHALTLATRFYALLTRVYGIAPSKCPFPYQHPLPLVWFCYHRSLVSECKHCICEGGESNFSHISVRGSVRKGGRKGALVTRC